MVRIYIQHRTTVLSQAEMDELLPPYPKFGKLKRFYRNICEWKLIIDRNNVEYEICLNGIKKHDYTE